MSEPQPQPTPAIKTITLLEENKEAFVGDPNGTFTIQLKEELILKEGDELQVSKAFVDTTTIGSNFITVDDDETEIEIKTGIYYRDVVENTPSGTTPPVTYTRPAWGKWSVDTTERRDGQKYILQNQEPSYLNTFFDWKGTDNPALIPLPSPYPPDFNVELSPIDPVSNNGFQYNIIPEPAPGDTPAFPASPNLPLEQKYMLGGHMVFDQTKSEIRFLFYPRTFVPSGSTPAANDHTAVITRWRDSTNSILGWKVIANPDTTNTVEEQKWLFAKDQFGYNYFGDRGKSHYMQLDSCIFPVNSNWDANLDPAKQSQVPAVTFRYTDQTGVKTLTKSFPFYQVKSDLAKGRLVNSGMKDFLKALRQNPNTPGGGSVLRIFHHDVPEEFQSGNGWDRDWEWWKWTQWRDPHDPNPQNPTPAIPPIVYSTDAPVEIRYTNFSTTKTPADSGFVNPESQYMSADKLGNVLQGYQLQFSTSLSNPTSSGSTMTPREYTTRFTINKGIYSYDAFAQLLTDKLNIAQTPVVGLYNNPDVPSQPQNFAGYSSSYTLQTSYELMMQYDGYNEKDTGIGYPNYPNNWCYSGNDILPRTGPNGETLPLIPARVNTNPGVQPFFISEDGTRLFSYDAANVHPIGGGIPQVVGAESLSFIFDESSSTFQIGQAHTPIYIDGAPIDPSDPSAGKEPGAKIVKQITVALNTDNSFVGENKIADTSSGIFITSLEPQSLFFNKMRLNRDILAHIGQTSFPLQNFSLNANSQFTGDESLTDVKCSPIILAKGREITGVFLGQDSLVSKNGNFYELKNGFAESIEDATPITISGDTLITASDDQSFYQIEIAGINQNEIIGQNQKNSLIQAIIGKYFSTNSFTSSNGDGITYQHVGDPLIIKNLRVRVLDTQGNVQSGLGPNSAIVLQLNTTK